MEKNNAILRIKAVIRSVVRFNKVIIAYMMNSCRRISAIFCVRRRHVISARAYLMKI